MLFDASYPIQLTRSGRIVLSAWAACDLVLLMLMLAAWLR